MNVRRQGILTIVSFCGISFLSADTPPAQPGVPQPPQAATPLSPQEQWKEKLGLSDEQAKKFQAAVQAHRMAAQKIALLRFRTLIQLRTQVHANAPEPEIKTNLKQLNELQKSTQAEYERYHETLAELLTPKQQAQLLIDKMDRQQRSGPGFQRPRSPFPPGFPGSDLMGADDDNP